MHSLRALIRPKTSATKSLWRRTVPATMRSRWDSCVQSENRRATAQPILDPPPMRRSDLPANQPCVSSMDLPVALFLLCCAAAFLRHVCGHCHDFTTCRNRPSGLDRTSATAPSVFYPESYRRCSYPIELGHRFR